MTVLDLARRLDAWRPADMTAAAWAKRAEFTQGMVADFRNHGKNITVEALLRLAAALDVEIDVRPRTARSATERPEFTPDEHAALDALGKALVGSREDVGRHGMLLDVMNALARHR